MKLSLDKIAMGALTICVLVLTGVVVRRELFLGGGGAPQRPKFVNNWQETWLPFSRSTNAPVTILEFGDFECSFCSEFYKTLKVVKERYPMEIDVAYVHFPIPGHRFAVPAARVAECARDQGRFEAMHDQLFEHQDDFGLKPWSEFAKAAGVRDLTAFNECVKRTDPIPRVEEGKALGQKLNIKGTPTIIINGWKLGHPPTEEELDGMVKKILAGKRPVGST
jgi:protein-disulfide isomerase